MKFFSAFLFFFYIRSAYSYYVGSAAPPNPIVSTNQYPIYNSQGTYQSIRPELQNAYPSNRQTVSVQPAPIQQEYNMGPGLPIPYQVAQTGPGLQNNMPIINPRASSRQLPDHISAVQYIAGRPHVKAKYMTSIPKKHYTIVHPNGTIEDTNEIHAITAQYPNYFMVKATDILAHLNKLNYKTSSRISQTTSPDQLNKTITTTNQKYEWTKNNSFERSQNSQLINNDFQNQTVANLNPINRNYPNTNSQESVATLTDNPKNSNIISSSPAGLNEPESILKEENDNTSTVQSSDKNAVAANPLPIYPTKSVPDNQEINKQPSETPVANNTVPVNPTETQVKTTSGSNSTNFSNDFENQILTSNQITSSKPTTTIQVPAQVDEHQVSDVNLSDLQQQSKLEETQTPNAIETPQKNEVTSEIITIEEPNESRNANLTTVLNNSSSSPNLAPVLASDELVNVSPSNTTVDENKETIDTSTISTKNTNILYINSNLVPSVSNQSSTFHNSPPMTWFRLSDNTVWDAIRNNASNVYFFFLPPTPKRYKETRKTIFPNGTTVEEVIERDVDKDQDNTSEDITEENIIS